MSDTGICEVIITGPEGPLLPDIARALVTARLVASDLPAVHADLGGQVALGHAQFAATLPDDFVHLHVVHP